MSISEFEANQKMSERAFEDSLLESCRAFGEQAKKDNIFDDESKFWRGYFAKLDAFRDSQSKARREFDKSAIHFT